MLISNISLVLYLVLSLGALLISLQSRRKAGKIKFSGQGKEYTILTVLIFILGGIYLLTSSGWFKYVIFLLAFVVYFYVSRFYVGEDGIKYGIYYIPYEKVRGYRQYNGTNDVTLYIEGKVKEIYLKPKIEYQSSLIESMLEMKGVSSQYPQR
ncbi:hypothetical protein M3231_07095 [Neobacillus mesonae]|nr:hypothetical protein [Neobacillus mesonae]